MKKIFNLAVIFAAMMTAVSFTSCDDSEDKVIDNFENDKVTPVTELQVVAGKSYQAYQENVAAFTFNVKSTSGSYKDGNQVVEFQIENADGKKDVSFILSDEGASYLMRNADGTYEAVKKAVADENADKIVMVLAGANSKANYTITSGTINTTLKANGAKETKFAEKK